MIANPWGSILLILNKFGVLSLRVDIETGVNGYVFNSCDIKNFFGVN